MGRLPPAAARQSAAAAQGLSRCATHQTTTLLRKELNRIIAKAKTAEARKEALNRFKDQELFRIDMKHIVEPGTNLPTSPWRFRTG